MTNCVIHEYDLYLNEEVFEHDYIDDEQLCKASEIIHQYFDRKVTINLNGGYQLVFDPISETSSHMVGKILTSDCSNLQNYIHMLRFRKTRILNKRNKKHKNKIALALDNHLQSVYDKYDKDGFTSYNPNYISDVVGELNKTIIRCFERNDFSFTKLSKKFDDDKLVIYQTLREIVYILDLFFNHS